MKRVGIRVAVKFRAFGVTFGQFDRIFRLPIGTGMDKSEQGVTLKVWWE